MTTMKSPHGPLRVGVGGPVGSGKTALMDALCKHLRERYEIAAITNDIYTKWDAEFLVRSGALAPERIAGVETGGCPHTAIREESSLPCTPRWPELKKNSFPGSKPATPATHTCYFWALVREIFSSSAICTKV